MHRVVEAIIKTDGSIELMEPVTVDKDRRALVIILHGVEPLDGLRPYGLCAGQFVVPDDFDAPLPDDILAAFEGDERA
jgi:hypothetical protein